VRLVCDGLDFDLFVQDDEGRKDHEGRKEEGATKEGRKDNEGRKDEWKDGRNEGRDGKVAYDLGHGTGTP
jgi:hypothetical protein